jgi:AcrR family transcriptional regulator
MRRLARELGVTAMSFYRYFPGKRELLDAVAEAAFADAPAPALEGTWREQLTALSSAARQALDRHPCVAQIRALQPVLGAQTLHFAEHALRILEEEAGLARDEAVLAYRTLFTYLMGFAAFSPARAEQQARATAEQALSSLPPEYFPRLSAAVAEAAEAMSGDDAFAYGLERILDGLERRRDGQA